MIRRPSPPARKIRPRKQRKVEERVWLALFGRQRHGNVLAIPLRIWPDPKPQILAAIKKAIG